MWTVAQIKKHRLREDGGSYNSRFRCNGTIPLFLSCGQICIVDSRLGQISNNVPGKSPAGIFEEKEANHFF